MKTTVKQLVDRLSMFPSDTRVMIENLGKLWDPLTPVGRELTEGFDVDDNADKVSEEEVIVL